MEKDIVHHTRTNKKMFIRRNGRLYFSQKTERKFFFVLTLMMLLSGILLKAGLL